MLLSTTKEDNKVFGRARALPLSTFFFHPRLAGEGCNRFQASLCSACSVSWQLKETQLSLARSFTSEQIRKPGDARFDNHMQWLHVPPPPPVSVSHPLCDRPLLPPGRIPSGGGCGGGGGMPCPIQGLAPQTLSPLLAAVAPFFVSPLHLLLHLVLTSPPSPSASPRPSPSSPSLSPLCLSASAYDDELHYANATAAAEEPHSKDVL